MKKLTIMLLTAQVYAATAGDTSERFYQAIRTDDLAALTRLATASLVDSRDGHGTTPLMYAAALGSEAAVRLLLEAGADPNAKNDFDATPLIWGAGEIGKVRLLLAKGADVNARSRLGRTTLMTAAYHDGGSQIVKLLVAKGANAPGRSWAIDRPRDCGGSE